jgi:hypothetical protein
LALKAAMILTSLGGASSEEKRAKSKYFVAFAYGAGLRSAIDLHAQHRATSILALHGAASDFPTSGPYCFGLSFERTERTSCNWTQAEFQQTSADFSQPVAAAKTVMVEKCMHYRSSRS